MKNRETITMYAHYPDVTQGNRGGVILSIVVTLGCGVLMGMERLRRECFSGDEQQILTGGAAHRSDFIMLYFGPQFVFYLCVSGSNVIRVVLCISKRNSLTRRPS